MKRLLLYLLSASLLSASSLKTDTKDVQVSGRLHAYLQNIDVYGGGNETRRDGTTHNEELNLNIFQKLSKSQRGVNLRVRGTNDRRIQKDGAEILYLRGYYIDKIWDIEAGDVASSLNPYVFSGTLKGIKTEYKSPKKRDTFNYLFTAGAKKARWRDLYNQDENEENTAYGGAVEVRYMHKRSQEIALSSSIYQDDLSTGCSVNTDVGKKGYTIGVDGKWRFNKYITLKGYGAFVSATDDIKNDKSYQDSSAITLKLLTRPILKYVKSNFKYQRVSAKYVPLAGIGANDKEQIENTTHIRITKDLKAKIDLKAKRDDVDNDELDESRDLYYERLALSYYLPFLRRANLDLRIANKDLEGRGTDNNTLTAGVNLLIRNKSGFRYGGGYEYNRFDQDTNTTKQVQYTNNFNLLFGYKQKISKERFFRFMCRTSYRSISHSQDTIGLKVDAGYTHNKRLSADLLYLLNNTDREDSGDTQNYTYQFRGAYKLDDKGKNVLRLLLEKRDVRVDDKPSNSYDEYIQKLSLVMNF